MSRGLRRLFVPVLLSALWSGPAPALGQALGAAQSFALLGGSAVTGNGGLVTGDVGVAPGTSITGFPPTVIAPGFGTHSNDGPAVAAQAAAASLYSSLAGQGPAVTLAAQLNGVTLAPGVYRFTSTADIASGGELTLSGSGTYIFQVGSAVTANVGSRVTLTGGATACNVFWQVTSAATLNGNSFSGTVVAQSGVTLGVGASLTGRALVTVGAVTMAGANAVGGCSAAVPCPSIVLSPSVLPGATLGAAYSQQLAASGGTAPYAFTLTSGALPGGVTLSPTGLISGVPMGTGSFAFTVQATDANGCFGVRSYTIDVLPAGCPAIVVSPATLPGGTVGAAYSQQFLASGGTAPYTFVVSAGALPPGLTLSPGGLLAGTLTTAGDHAFTIQATDANGCFGIRSYTISVLPAGCPGIAINPATLPGGTVGTPYSQQLVASGGTAPYTFSITAGALPPGLTLSPGGLLAGTVTTAGVSSFTVRATDANGCFATRPYTLSVLPAGCPDIAVSPATLPGGTVGTAYSQQLFASGGTAPYTFAVTAGALPPGITLSPGGLFAGTLTTAGDASFTVRATDANGCFGIRSYTISVLPAGCPVIAVAPATLPGGTVGAPYSQAITATGGTAPYTFALTTGALPAGLTLLSTGLLSGTPTTAALSSFTVRVTDANGCFADRAYTLTVVAPGCPAIAITPPTLPGGRVGVAYSVLLIASGGTSPYVFSIPFGSLPSGLTAVQAGASGFQIAGTPLSPGTFNFTVQATDAAGCIGAVSYTLTVAPPTVPTLPGWGLLLLAVALGLAGILRLRASRVAV